MTKAVTCPYCYKELKNELGIKMHLTKGKDCLPIESFVHDLSLEERNHLATNKVKLIQRNLGELKRRIPWDNGSYHYGSESSFNEILRQVREVLKLIEVKNHDQS